MCKRYIIEVKIDYDRQERKETISLFDMYDYIIEENKIKYKLVARECPKRKAKSVGSYISLADPMFNTTRLYNTDDYNDKDDITNYFNSFILKRKLT